MNKISETEAELSPEYILGLIESEAHRRLGISAGELLARYERDELEDPGRVADLIALADLLLDPPAAA